MTHSSTILRTYKYRLYPTPAQEARLNSILAIAWRIWNDALHMRVTAYRERGETISTYDLRDYWCALRKTHDEIGALPYGSVDDLIRRLDKAYKAFFKRRKDGVGFPKEKKRHQMRSIGYVYGKGIKILDGNGWACVRVAHVGDVTLRLHRPIPEGADIRYVIVSRTKSGWYASFQMYIPHDEPQPSTKPAVGIDIGIAYLLALSDGTTIDNPRWYREAQTERRVLQRKLDRQRRANNPQNYNADGTVKPGAFIWRKSYRMRETERLLRELDGKVQRQRADFWHNITDWLTNTYGLIALEELTLEFMQQNKRTSMSAADASFGTFWQYLKYKAEARGVELVWVRPQYTSQACSECGAIDRDNRKTQARFKCLSCGHEENADLNAAKNILNLGTKGACRLPVGETWPVTASVPYQTNTQDAVAIAGTE